jgi:hypothetical protein
VEFALLAVLKFFPESNSRIFFLAGPSYNYFVSTSMEVVGYKSPIDNTNFMRKNQYCGELGFGFEQSYLRLNLGLEIRYQHCFGQTNNSTARYITDSAGQTLIYGLYYVPEDIEVDNLRLNVRLGFNINYDVHGRKTPKKWF